ncbi:hypothetical protein B0T10DRAFT_180273 [Thelonectria olida]|uniref:Uncharacterized protein n=1 Tax=Thelonectria olida TaxID=1576542 RepID=A0A9P8WER1_9HYPO|nr:hypothetical protein B0T10DRAFT_180273 [Thelonectria olida]
MTDYRSIDAIRLEIVLIAAGVLLLVSIMGILILFGVGLRPPDAYRYTVNGQRRTPWGAIYNAPNERRPTVPYRDTDDTLFTSIRRRSQSLATEIRNELGSLTHNFTTGMGSWPTSQQQEESTILDTLRSFNIDRVLSVSRHSSDADSCDTCSEFLNSPVSATGREDEPHGARIRLLSLDTKCTTSCHPEA